MCVEKLEKRRHSVSHPGAATYGYCLERRPVILLNEVLGHLRNGGPVPLNSKDA